MIRIKAVDIQNMLEVCNLTAQSRHRAPTMMKCPYCNAISIAETKYRFDMHPFAIYNNHVLIGFFMYQRPENRADTATICRFMIDDRFRQKDLPKRAFEHILRGLKIQGVKRVRIATDSIDEEEENLYLSFGFQSTEEKAKYHYELKL